MVKKLLLFIVISLFAAMAAFAQGTGSATGATSASNSSKTKSPAFRSTKDQVREAQTMLKGKGMFSGEATGTSSAEWKIAVKSYQGANGLAKTGSLNRATLEKMGIALTEKQQEIPVNPKHIASTESKPATSSKSGMKAEKSATTGPKKPAPFTATKDQIMELQKVLKAGKMFDGEANGERSDALKDAVKKYQEANSLKATGGINAETLGKAGIALTDKQKDQVAAQAAYDAAKAQKN